MSDSQKSYLRFSLEESVWFKKGQEVSELVSISLDPYISIQEQEQYVLIRGNLELSGEYTADAAAEADEDEVQSGKFMHEVEVREEGPSGFKHRFPVDITIPKNRIENLEKIDVTVETFDYILPEKSCLRLSADLIISGIYGEQQTKTEPEAETVEYEPLYRESAVLEETEEAETVNEPFFYHQQEEEEQEEEDSFYSPFAAQARKQPQEEEEVPVQVQYDLNKLPTLPQYNRFAEEYSGNPVFQMPEAEESSSSSSSGYEPYDMYKDKEQETAQSSPQNAHPYENANEAAEEEHEEQEAQPAAKKGEDNKKAKKKKNQGISLTDFFARKEEERSAKLKVCIVQNGDTLDSIAERYDVSVQQLLRVNSLEMSQDVYEGQVLYISNEYAYKK
ncbi:stage VI sporulation protein D [Falsibacillus pallidus]|uniref:Stage VI sporulation protein D n=1 Tax=Falsibacillus pallidus TaxID=493781 RepID=A0A370GKH6_9BACI|nr:stage VI sporulation protein D [Falsibacillus pallidus]RDI44171.1 stage VI sporulation protein D [Falsibacillus pallidus]